MRLLKKLMALLLPPPQAVGATIDEPAKKPQPAAATSPFITAEQLRAQIAAATGVPIENVKLLPMQYVQCNCEKCQRQRQSPGMRRYAPSLN